MKLYKTHDSAHSTNAIVWTASQSDASKAKTAMQEKLKAEGLPHKGVVWEPVEIDTKKEGLLTFLNSGAAR